MFNKIDPEMLVGCLIEKEKDFDFEISFEKLHEIRSKIEASYNEFYVDITYNSIKRMVNSNPDIFEFEDTKIIIHKQTSYQGVFESYFKNAPECYKKTIELSVSNE